MTQKPRKELSVEENIRKAAEEVKKWPKWKLDNTRLAFSEYQRRKSEDRT